MTTNAPPSTPFVFDVTLSLQAMSHMVPVKLTSNNYLMWHAQVFPLLATQKFLPYVDGTSPPPPATVVESRTSKPNPAYATWLARDQIVRVFLMSTLTEETMAVVVGCSTSAALWNTLATTFNRSSKARELRLKDELQLLKKGSRSVSEFGAQFKYLCDQLASMGCVLDDTDKSHWFFRGLGPEFLPFATSQINLVPLPTFHDLLSKSEAHSLFTQSLDATTIATSTASTTAAFVANTKPQHHRGGHSNRGNYQGGRSHSGNQSGGRGFPNNGNSGSRGRGRFPPRCQICRIEGHYASWLNHSTLVALLLLRPLIGIWTQVFLLI